MGVRLVPARMNEMIEPKADISPKGVIICSRDRVWDPTQMRHVRQFRRSTKARVGVMLTVHLMPDYLE
jgi:hypothetical protein